MHRRTLREPRLPGSGFGFPTQLSRGFAAGWVL
jgi:hypothetical protein